MCDSIKLHSHDLSRCHFQSLHLHNMPSLSWFLQSWLILSHPFLLSWFLFYREFLSYHKLVFYCSSIYNYFLCISSFFLILFFFLHHSFLYRCFFYLVLPSTSTSIAASPPPSSAFVTAYSPYD